MPGHKRNTALAGERGYLQQLGAFADITEIAGFDDLNHPQGLFLACMRMAAQLWQSEETLFSVNGGTGGILAAIYGCLPYGGKAIVARNCHQAVYHALELRGAEAVYTLPVQDRQTGIWGAASAADIESLLARHPDTRLVIVTSPTYEGVVSDIRGIAAICHQRRVPLLVDEAHGCHFGFGYGFPERAVGCGADIVVQSLHKTLAGLTQTALVHLNGSLVERTKIRRALTVFQSSSPSYILAASIDGCVRLLEQRGGTLFAAWQNHLDRFHERVSGLKRLRLLQAEESMFALDRSKIVIVTGNAGITGAELMETLRRQYRIELEMAAPAYVIAMTGIGDSWDNLRLLGDALLEIDASLNPVKREAEFPPFVLPEKVKNAAEAESMPQTAVAPAAAAGRVSGEYVLAYPPGIPLLVPGERITPAALRQAEACRQCGIRVESTYSGLPEKIFVLKA